MLIPFATSSFASDLTWRFRVRSSDCFEERCVPREWGSRPCLERLQPFGCWLPSRPLILPRRLTGPIEIRNTRGAFPPDSLWNTATEYSFEAVYGDGVRMIVSNKERMGVTWQGTEGTVYANRGKLETDPKSLVDSVIGPDEIHLYASENHFRNFTDCVLSRGPTAAPVEVAHRSITIAHLGNIAMRLGRERLRWDPRTEQIIGDDEASAQLSRPYRDPWKLPTV